MSNVAGILKSMSICRIGWLGTKTKSPVWDCGRYRWRGYLTPKNAGGAGQEIVQVLLVTRLE
jgi:hypothetical protein